MPPSLSPQVKSLLSLTGQIHTEEFPYDKVYSVFVNTPDSGTVVAALGKKGTRVVDIVVLPAFRKLGLATTLINIADVNTAYVVSEEAEEFWSHIGWCYFYDTVDKGTKVKVFVKDRKVKIE